MSLDRLRSCDELSIFRRSFGAVRLKAGVWTATLLVVASSEGAIVTLLVVASPDCPIARLDGGSSADDGPISSPEASLDRGFPEHVEAPRDLIV